MKQYSVLKKKEILYMVNKTWRNLQEIMLSEISQSEKLIYFYLYEVFISMNGHIHWNKQNGR